jgi:hypothetical protein
LTYERELVVVGREAELAQKGLSFHQIAEAMDSTKTEQDLYDLAKKILDDSTFDQEKYPVIKSIKRFYLWWQVYIKAYENAGWTLYKETWENGKLVDKPLVGAIDCLLVAPDKKSAIIIDYKTAATAKADSYKDQLLLYAWMVAKRLHIDDYTNVKCYVFFPLAGLKDEDENDSKKTAEVMMYKMMKQILFTNQDVEAVVSNCENIIKDADNLNLENWDSQKNATMSFSCSFCPFLGNKEYCPESYAHSFRFPRKAKVYTKTELKALEKNA